MTGTETHHRPVLLDETLDGLQLRSGGDWLDGTVGGGGHAEGILRGTAPDGRLLALDRDPAAIERAARRLAPWEDRVRFVHGSFADLTSIARDVGVEHFAGILLDLGFSSDQLDDATRGFSFQREGPLDMRLDPTSDRTARDLVNELPEDRLADIIYRYGEERASRRIAAAIVAARPIGSTTELADAIASARGVQRHGRIHPATRTFQALRIAVNSELDALREALPQAIEILEPGGRLAVIAFHSLEDRIVKRTFRAASTGCTCPPELPICVCDPKPTVRLVGPQPVMASEAERARNPRARSARLRIVERRKGVAA